MGIGLAVVFVAAGLWLLLSSRSSGRHAISRPSRDSFRSGQEDAPPLKRMAVVVNPTKLEGDGSAQKGVISGVAVQGVVAGAAGITVSAIALFPMLAHL